MRHPNARVMHLVLAYAKKYRSVAAFLVKGDRIIAKEVTSVYTENLPTRHAEINALDSAARKLKNLDLPACWLYSSLECCPMCTAAACWAELEGIVYSATEEDWHKAQPGKNWISMDPGQVIACSDHKPKLFAGFLRKEGKAALARDWDNEFMRLVRTKYARVFKMRG